MTLVFVIEMRSSGPQPFCSVVRPEDYNVYFETVRVRKDAFIFMHSVLL